MKTSSLLCLTLSLAAGIASAVPSPPIARPDLVFAERDGLVAFEAEHFVSQEKADVRAFHLFTPTQRPRLTPDTDDTHIRDASGSAYLEILPDTRWSHDEVLVVGENFSDVPGRLALLSYKIHFTTPGRYRVWARNYSTGPEDNGMHFGLNGTWPESGQRFQTVKKFGWSWDSRQRTKEVHVGVPRLLYLDIETAGEHTIQISMREDGVEIDKLILAKDFDYEPAGHGPAPIAHRGQIPAAFALPDGYLEAIAPTTPVIHSYPNDGAQEKMYRPLLGSASPLTGASLQNQWDMTHRQTLKWLRASAAAGKPWVCANDEQGPASIGVPPDAGYRGFDGVAIDGKHSYTAHDTRKATLWGNLMAGGAGVEYYFGYKMLENDLVAEDYRSRDQSWDYSRIALALFREQKIPFWEMTNANALVGNTDEDNSRYCFAKAGEIYLVYLPSGGETNLDLSGVNGAFAVSWFNPRTGGPLTSAAKVKGGGAIQLTAPNSEDWLAIVRRSAK